MRFRPPWTGRATRSYAPGARPSRSPWRTSRKTSSPCEAGRGCDRPHIGPAAQLAAAPLHGLHAIAAIDARPVAAGAAADVITAAPVGRRVQAVVAASAIQPVAALVAVQPVAAAVAVDPVAAVASGGAVAALPPEDQVVPAAAEDAI